MKNYKIGIALIFGIFIVSYAVQKVSLLIAI
jgi:hypothetical protein